MYKDFICDSANIMTEKLFNAKIKLQNSGIEGSILYFLHSIYF
jgi:hypothetical protein